MRTLILFFLIFSQLAFADPISISIDKFNYESSESIKAVIHNSSQKSIWIHTSCMPLYNIEKYENGEWLWIDYYPTKKIKCKPKNNESKPLIEISANKGYKLTITLKANEMSRPKIGIGKYRVRYNYSESPDSQNKKVIYSQQFKLTKI